MVVRRFSANRAAVFPARHHSMAPFMDIDNGLDFLPADSEKTFETTDSLLVYDILLDLSSRRGKPWRLLNGDARMIFCVLKKLLLPLRLLGNPLSRKGSVVFFWGGLILYFTCGEVAGRYGPFYGKHHKNYS